MKKKIVLKKASTMCVISRLLILVAREVWSLEMEGPEHQTKAPFQLAQLSGSFTLHVFARSLGIVY